MRILFPAWPARQVATQCHGGGYGMRWEAVAATRTANAEHRADERPLGPEPAGYGVRVRRGFEAARDRERAIAR